MPDTLLPLIAFGVITFGLGACFLLIRDLAVAGDGKAAAGPFRLRRMPLARDEQLPRNLIGYIDYGLERISFESGLGLTPMSAVLMLIFFGLLAGGPLLLWVEAPLPAVIGFVGGMMLALAILYIARGRYIRKLQEQLPPALEMLARGVRAGESLDQAVGMVGEKSPEPLAKEFRRCAKQLQMGLSMSAVMRALVFRVRLTDLRIFTATLSVHRQMGGNLAWTLERLAAVIRDRIAFRRQMRATTGAGRVSATMIAVTGPLLFLYMFFVQPEYVGGLLDSALGQSLLAVAAGLEIIGLVWVARLLKAGQ